MQKLSIFIKSCFLFFVTFCTVLSACSTNMSPVDEMKPEEKDTVVFDSRITAGKLETSFIKEASGLDASLTHPGYFWTHNDSGDDPEIFLISESAIFQMKITLDNTQNRDWEDIAVSRDIRTGKNLIYVGEIGDNLAKFEEYKIHIFEEPSQIGAGNILNEYYQTITYNYPDGPRDAETLLVEPSSGDIYIVSKRESEVGIYRIKYPYEYEKIITAEKLGVIPFSSIVAGDIATDGKSILLKDYTMVYYWDIRENDSIYQTLTRTPYKTPYVTEPQGEAVCWDITNKAFYTLSESGTFNITPVLYKYEKRM